MLIHEQVARNTSIAKMIILPGSLAGTLNSQAFFKAKKWMAGKVREARRIALKNVERNKKNENISGL